MTAADITIELGSAPSGGCPCCDPEASIPQGYVLKTGRPHAIYFADWDYGASGYVELMISVGNWEKDSTPADRRAAAFRGRFSDGALRWTGFDANMSLWRDIGMIGGLLTGEDAGHDSEFGKLADTIAAEDPRIRKALEDLSSEPAGLLRPLHRNNGDFSAAAVPQGRR